MREQKSQLEIDTEIINGTRHSAQADSFQRTFPTLEDLQKHSGKNSKKRMSFPKLFTGVLYSKATPIFATITLILTILLVSNRDCASEYGVRTKGTAAISLVQKRGGELFIAMKDSVNIQLEDTLQFVIHAKEQQYYTVWADSAGSGFKRLFPDTDTFLSAGSPEGEPIAITVVCNSVSYGYTLLCVASSDSSLLPISLDDLEDPVTNCHYRRVHLK